MFDFSVKVVEGFPSAHTQHGFCFDLKPIYNPIKTVAEDGNACGILWLGLTIRLLRLFMHRGFCAPSQNLTLASTAMMSHTLFC